MTEPRTITSNIDLLLDTLPLHIRQSIEATPGDTENLLEIVMDLGRLPEARYRGQERFLSEREVLTATVAGRSNDEIAATLGITTRTVEAHLTRLYDRFDLHSRTELVARAVAEGWLDIPAEA